MNGLQYIYKGKTISFNEMKPLMKANPEAYANIKQANTRAAIGNVMGYAGGFMIGWPLGTYIAGGDPIWGMALAGLGLGIASIPILLSSNKKGTQAVNLHNAGINSPNPKKRKPVTLGFSPTGMSLQYQF